SFLSERVKQRRLDRRASEMTIGRKRHALHLSRRPFGKSAGDLLLDDALSDSERPISERAEPRADASRRFPRERAQGCDRSSQRVVLGAVAKGRLHDWDAVFKGFRSRGK